MRRMHLMEIEDQPWCPKVLRDGLTDFLQISIDLGRPYTPAAKRLADAIRQTGATRVVDLCSGGGGPWQSLLAELERQGASVDVVLTDWYPNLSALERIAMESGGKITYRRDRIDAKALPEDLTGFRTLFTSFHHFRPADARAILEDAVRKRQPIGVFELTSRHPFVMGTILLSPLGIWLLTPLVRPFRWSRLILTYLIPLIPLGVLFDGIVSCFRTYSPRELQEMTEDLGGDAYTWEIGQTKAGKFPTPVTYLIGKPVG